MILSEAFKDDQDYTKWDNFLFPYEMHWMPSVSDKRIQQISEEEIQAFEDQAYKNCCLLSLTARVRNLTRDIISIPLSCMYSLGQCTLGFGACACAGLGTAATVALAGLFISEGESCEGCGAACACIGACCLGGTVLCGMGWWTAALCVIGLSK